MGRELKRVPLEFGWPLGTLWSGYVNPHHRPCPEAGRTCVAGATAGAAWLAAIVRLLTLAAEEAQYTGDATAQAHFARSGRLWPHPWLLELPTRPHEATRSPPRSPADFATPPPTPDLLDLVARLTGEQPRGPMGYGGAAEYKLTKRLLKAAKLDPDTWGTCPVCKGEALDPAARVAHEAWRKTEPPRGEGYQLWTTTSEGAPLSPVFATLDELCAWCETGATTFADIRASAAEWKRMLDDGFVAHVEGNNVFF